MTAGPTRKLIHFPVDKLAPKGGPAGYLYNLKHGLEELGDAEFDFLPVEGSSYEQNATLQKLACMLKRGSLFSFETLLNIPHALPRFTLAVFACPHVQAVFSNEPHHRFAGKVADALTLAHTFAHIR